MLADHSSSTPNTAQLDVFVSAYPRQHAPFRAILRVLLPEGARSVGLARRTDGIGRALLALFGLTEDFGQGARHEFA